MSERVIAYIDGFNLYFGLRDNGWRSCYWLNVKLLCEGLLLPNQQLIQTKYFTSRIRGNPSKCARQDAFIRAIKTIPGISVRKGRYSTKTYECRNCSQIKKLPSEKMTDVRIASEMVSDAHLNKYDTAFLITGDKDFVPAIEIIKSQLSRKCVVVIFPPNRQCDDLKKIANVALHISKGLLRRSLLPRVITLPHGRTITCPPSWT